MADRRYSMVIATSCREADLGPISIDLLFIYAMEYNLVGQDRARSTYQPARPRGSLALLDRFPALCPMLPAGHIEPAVAL